MAERVLITGARAPAALELARSFAAAGFEAHMADCSRARIARWSRTPAEVHAYASPRRDPDRFARDVAALVARLDPVLIVPACEEVFHLAALAQRGRLDARLFAPPLAALARLHSKIWFAEDCSTLGLPVPQTVRVADRPALSAFAAEASQRVFKPEFSRFGAHALVGPEPGRLETLHPTSEAPWVVQTKVRGEEVSFYAVAVDGRLVAFSAYRSSWRLPGGAAYAFEPLEPGITARLRAMAEALAHARVGRGQFACDLILDAAGEPWLIECNPRATSGVHLFTPGPDLALATLGRSVGPVEGVAPAHLGAALWRYGLPQALGSDRLADWKQQRRIGRDVLSAPGDPGPVAGALMDSFGFGARALIAGVSLEEAMTADIEWNGEAL